jgi:2-iminobutanoate/2-iminopropanoate deaminase
VAQRWKHCEMRYSGRVYYRSMKLNPVNSPSAPQAAGGYSQALEVRGAQRLLFIGGQIPESRTGEVPKEFRAQAKLAWSNLLAQLEAADMSVTNIVKVTTFLSSRDFASANREIRQEILGAHAPALTVIVVGIFDEQWLVEIEAVAAA